MAITRLALGGSGAAYPGFAPKAPTEPPLHTTFGLSGLSGLSGTKGISLQMNEEE